MRKRLLALLLSLVMLAGAASPTAFAAPRASGSSVDAKHWFSNQLTERGKDIYDALVWWYGEGGMGDGKASYDLVANKVVTPEEVETYLDGNRTLFNDFAAAKDAFDLEHPEAWYVDSSDLSFLVTRDSTSVHAYMGPGRTEDYYVTGVSKEDGAADVDAKSELLTAAVQDIVYGANALENATDAAMVRYVHNKIIHKLSYRYETECAPANVGFIRTAYALVTGEAVCEGYARSFQYVMNKLDIPCVLIHGFQTSGEPEAHMWCAVWLKGSEDAEGAWYVVDPTWDDPVKLDASGHIIKDKVDDPETGEKKDGGERTDYLLVGQSVVGEHWKPSGYVSTSATEFTYPEISQSSYGEINGLQVTYADSTMEDVDSTVYHVSFNGDGLVQSAEKGYYFLVYMKDVNVDGSVNEFEGWYYAAHGLYFLAGFDRYPNEDFKDTGNPHYYDTDKYMVQNIAQCEYVAFAVTTAKPYPWTCPDDLVVKPGDDDYDYYRAGYYVGDGSDIVAQTGLMEVPNGDYEQPPYAKNVSPVFSTPVYVGTNYTIHMEFTDPLYHPDQASVDRAPAGKVYDAEKAMAQAVALDYTGTKHSWGVNGGQPHTFTKKPKPANVKWECETHGNHEGMEDINAACRLTALEYDFSASKWWADDSVSYKFYLTGLVGVKSNKFLTGWDYVFENDSAPCAYRCSQGIDWNLWGQPQLLDNPNNLDLGEISMKGVNDETSTTLDELRESMHLDDKDMNGRLVLTVEQLDPNRFSAEELAAATAGNPKADPVPSSAVLSSSLYEIDFARICSQTIVKTGQKVRLQVGFPPGFDSSMAGVVFKAYHFTRDETTGMVISVEEIPITVTQYGLIIMCDSFSPFEIVALDATNEELVLPEDSGDRYVVMTSDGHGKVEGDVAGDPDRPGMVRFESGSSHTFTVTPDEGYQIGSITFDGETTIKTGSGAAATEPAAYDGPYSDDTGTFDPVYDGLYGDSDETLGMIQAEPAGGDAVTFALTYDDLGGSSAILDVTFIPSSALKAGETLEAPAVCTHPGLEHVDYLAPACMTPGHTAGMTAQCQTCGQAVVSETIPFTGHVYDADGRCQRCPAVKISTVTFDANGGTLTGSPTAPVGEDGSNTLPSIPGSPTRTGYTFDGWYRYTATGDSEPVTLSTKFTEDTTVYAHWTENRDSSDNPETPGGSGNQDNQDNQEVYTITLQSSPAQGGSVAGGGNYRKAQPVTASAVPAGGYHFVHWMENGAIISSGPTYSFTATADRTLTAVFELNGDGIFDSTAVADDSTTAADGSITAAGEINNGSTAEKAAGSSANARKETGVKAENGTKTEETAADGTVTTRQTLANGVQITTVRAPGAPMTVSVTIPAGMERATVTIDTAVTPGTVAVNAATDEIIQRSIPTANGLKVTLEDSTTFMMEDQSKAFTDTESHWAKDSIAFVTAHGLFSGTSETAFEPRLPMTRAMLMTVLARLDGEETAGGGTWYEKSMAWAVANGISDGSNPQDQVTREQLAAMLWRYMGEPAVTGSMGSFPDTGNVHSWAGEAMTWAVQNGIINGSNDGNLYPGNNALRSEVAAMLTRFCQNIEY